MNDDVTFLRRRIDDLSDEIDRKAAAVKAAEADAALHRNISAALTEIINQQKKHIDFLVASDLFRTGVISEMREHLDRVGLRMVQVKPALELAA